LKFEPDPREIGYAFHGAGTEIGQKRVFFKVLRIIMEKDLEKYTYHWRSGFHWISSG
jgi:hypothetical protein